MNIKFAKFTYVLMQILYKYFYPPFVSNQTYMSDFQLLEVVGRNTETQLQVDEILNEITLGMLGNVRPASQLDKFVQRTRYVNQVTLNPK